MGDQQWNGPGEHGFAEVPDLLNSIGELDRFLSRKESLAILHNGVLFAQQDGLLDASDDRNRPGIITFCPLFFFASSQWCDLFTDFRDVLKSTHRSPYVDCLTSFI